ncbi:MAG: PD40 domain-containing protein [Flavobacteriia bacterium]|nr:PD40 domain-containing protein [Flavobacteriia bacterium]
MENFFTNPQIHEYSMKKLIFKFQYNYFSLMNKYLTSLLFVFLLFSCSMAQQKYSTSNKKAIALFEEGLESPRKNIDPRTGRPDYESGIVLIKKAIEKDPTFWEAQVAVAELYEESGKIDEAISHYEKAIEINPQHSLSGSTYFYLAYLKYYKGAYSDCIQNLRTFMQYKSANQDFLLKAKEMLSSAEFAQKAMENPVQFNPVNVGPGINSADPEYFPTITVDGKTLLFTRRIDDNRVPGPIKEQEDFYVSYLSDKNIWTKAEPMPQNINTINNEGAPTIAADGRTLIFVACPDHTGVDYGSNRKGKGSCDLFITQKIGKRWLDPSNLNGGINTFAWETQPSLSSDGKTIYFIRGSKNKAGNHDSDIYSATLQDDGNWSKATRLPELINTPYEETSVLIHPDGRTLYFASKGHVGLGGSDLFLSRMDELGNWTKPINLGYPINTHHDENSLLVNPDGEIAFFASNREGGYGDLDIYYFEMPEHLRPIKTLYFDGIVFDAQNKSPLAGKFQLIDLKTGKEIVRSEADKVNGEFIVSLPVDREYALNVSYPGYHFFSQNFNMISTEGLESIHMDVPLFPIVSSTPVVLNNVFFDLNKASLRPESFIELNKLKEFLLQNSTVKIEVSGHTDTRGEEKENLLLSENRAKSVLDYLVSQGIPSNRITSKGYGESQPVIKDVEISKLSSEKEKEKAHQKNRRTEYKVIK